MHQPPDNLYNPMPMDSTNRAWTVLLISAILRPVVAGRVSGLMTNHHTSKSPRNGGGGEDGLELQQHKQPPSCKRVQEWSVMRPQK